MKKIITLAILTIIANVIFAQGGRIKVYFAGFDCYRETWDDILHTDGKGDEVFFTTAFTLGDKNGNSKLSYEKRSAVYGDATGPFSNRISVGSFVDLFGNNKGGIKAGDNYRCNNLIGEYDMADGDILTIVPTGWEHDPISDNSISFTSTIKSFYNSINQKVAPIMIGFNLLTGDLGAVIYNSASLGLSSIKAGGNQGEFGRPGTRPIGMEKFGDFSAKLVVLNTPNLTTICNNDMGFGKGVIAVNYNEAEVGNLRDHGNYTILLRVEFAPNAVTLASAPAPSTKTTIPSAPAPPPAPARPLLSVTAPTKTIKMAPPVKANNFPRIQTFVSGTWSGTRSDDQGLYPGGVSFQLTNTGEFIMANTQTGAVGAKGTYTFSNNIINGSYKLLGSGETISFTGTFDPNTQKLSCSLGMGTATTGQGKWTVTKQ